MAEIDRMAAAGMADVDDDDIDDDDDFDENDLLAELNEITSDREEEAKEEEDGADKPAAKSSSEIQNVLAERKEIYKAAIENAKAEGSSSKVRRFDRGLKEIDNLIKKASKGATISEDDIPPPVVIKVSKPINPATQTLPPPPTERVVAKTPVERFSAPADTPVPKTPEPQPVPETPQPTEKQIDNDKLTMLLERQKQFKVSALRFKHEGDIDNARKNLAIAKQFDSVIEAVKQGKKVDLSNMPKLPTDNEPPKTPAPAPPVAAPRQPPVQQSEQQTSASVSPPAPSTIMEALQQRLGKYQEAADKAKEEGNGGKVRRMARIVKQYEDAIKKHKLNKPVDFNELPCPPGFGPIPGVNAAADQPADPQEMAEMFVNMSDTDPAPQAQPRPAAPGPSATPSTAGSGAPTATRNEREYQFLVTRQREFKKAALECKQAGNIVQAKEYLRQAKGMDQMILAASNGMRVDVTTVPSLKRKSTSSLPQEGQQPTVQGLKEEISLTGSIDENYIFVETALRKQVETAQSNTDHYKLMGNIDAAKNFEALLKSSQRDLNTLMQYKQHKSPVPKCYYVKKTFPVTRSNPHLSDSELEITVVRCLNVPLQGGYQPKDMYTYVTFEMGYPQEKPQTGNTTTKKETINPEYNESFKVLIDRKLAAFKRFCRRGGINLKLFYVRGFLKSDKGIGQVNIKLNEFSSKCEIHQCVDILDLEKGRKVVGGKIEVLLKIREPFDNKDTEIVNEKWLILDSHLRGLEMKTPAKPTQKPSSASTGNYQSLEVMKSEKALFDRQLTAYKNQGRQPPSDLLDKIKLHEQTMTAIQNRLKQGGKPAVTEYLKNLLKGVEIEKTNAQNAAQKQDNQTAKNCLVKKKLLEKEIGILRQRLGL